MHTFKQGLVEMLIKTLLLLQAPLDQRTNLSRCRHSQQCRRRNMQGF